MIERKRSFETVVGPVTVTTIEGTLTGISFGGELFADADELLAEAEGQIREYLDGRRTSFLLPLRLSGISSFDRLVLEKTAGLSYGQTVSYGRLAEMVGTSARAVGGALSRNPLPLLIPCHRVVRSDGSLGGFTGGLGIKEKLLQLENSSHV